jgi:hypothetical protein
MQATLSVVQTSDENCGRQAANCKTMEQYVYFLEVPSTLLVQYIIQPPHMVHETCKG